MAIVMWQAVDAVGIDYQPVFDNQVEGCREAVEWVDPLHIGFLIPHHVHRHLFRSIPITPPPPPPPRQRWPVAYFVLYMVIAHLFIANL
jgi:hypothetical protein